MTFSGTGQSGDSPETEAQRPALTSLQTRVADLCPGPTLGDGVDMDEAELRRVVRKQLANLEQQDKEMLLRFVRKECAAQKAIPRLCALGGAIDGIPSAIAIDGSCKKVLLPPLQLARPRLQEPAMQHAPLPPLRRSNSLITVDRTGSARSSLEDVESARTKEDVTLRSKSISHPVLRMNRVASRRAEAGQLEDTPTDGADVSYYAASSVGSPLPRPQSQGEEGPEHYWTKVNTNAFGAFIHVALQSGLTRACLTCLPMVSVAVTIQLIFSEELITNHSTSLDINSRQRDSICWIPWKYQISAIVIFVTLVFHNIPGMVNAACLVFQATHHILGDGEEIGEIKEAQDSEKAQKLNISFTTRIIIYFIAVFSELTTFAFVVYAGCLFAATADSVDNVIRSTVSVMFVLNVDEIVFDSCCPGKIQADVRETEYLVPRIRMDASRVSSFVYYYTLYGHLPLLIGMSACLVLGLRCVSMCSCDCKRVCLGCAAAK